MGQVVSRGYVPGVRREATESGRSMNVVRYVSGGYAVLLACAVGVNFIATPLYADGGTSYPVWSVFNGFMGAGVVIAAGAGMIWFGDSRARSNIRMRAFIDPSLVIVTGACGFRPLRGSGEHGGRGLHGRLSGGKPGCDRAASFRIPGRRPPLLPRASGVALCCALTLPVVAGGAARASGCPEVEAPDEAIVLADRILHRETGDLLLDIDRRQTLAAEIGAVLSAVRSLDPEIEHVFARAAHAPGRLTIGLEQALFREIAPRLADGARLPTTGFAGFDSLNLVLAPRIENILSFSDVLILCYESHVNIVAAGEAYAAVPGVEYASPDQVIGDGPDVAVRRSNGIWFVAVREAWGDCPSGCLFDRVRFFTVEGGVATRTARESALERPEFQELVPEIRAGRGDAAMIAAAGGVSPPALCGRWKRLAVAPESCRNRKRNSPDPAMGRAGVRGLAFRAAFVDSARGRLAADGFLANPVRSGRKQP